MNELIEFLKMKSLINKSSLFEYHNRVRDTEEIKVLRDRASGVIVLSDTDQKSTDYYKKRSESTQNTKDAIRIKDNKRRKESFIKYIKDKHWLDFGCGIGSTLDEMAKNAKWACGVEINEDRISIVKEKKHRCTSSLDTIKDKSIDTVTLFHTLEHFSEPITILKNIHKKIKSSGHLIVEVPHARDALHDLYDCQSFKDFTFWSEHLILHTKESLRKILEHTGYTIVDLYGQQRYPLANHLYWLSKDKPGGHNLWNNLFSEELNRLYEKELALNDITDTLIAIAKPTT